MRKIYSIQEPVSLGVSFSAIRFLVSSVLRTIWSSSSLLLYLHLAVDLTNIACAPAEQGIGRPLDRQAFGLPTHLLSGGGLGPQHDEELDR